MIISLKKFGDVLTSRQAGKEAYIALSSLMNVKENESVIIDFSEVSTFAPGWGDEFLTPLQRTLGTRLSLIHTENPSVALTLETLESINGEKFI